jgi:hypothetical protein
VWKLAGEESGGPVEPEDIPELYFSPHSIADLKDKLLEDDDIQRQLLVHSINGCLSMIDKAVHHD